MECRKYKATIAHLASELGVNAFKVSAGLKNSNLTKDVCNGKSKYFASLVGNVNDYISNCGGKVPLKMYHLTIQENEKHREVIVYSHSMKIDGVERILVSVGPAYKVFNKHTHIANFSKRPY